MKAVVAMAALVAVAVYPASAAADQCRIDSDCEAGECSGGACIDFVKRDRQLLVEAEREGVIDDARSYEIVERRYWPLVWTGVGVFAASWIGTIVGVAVTRSDLEHSRKEALALSFVPIAGPLLMDAADVVPPDLDGIHVVMVAAQAAGVLGAIVGLTIETKVLQPVGSDKASIAPIAAPGFVGVGGTF